MARIEGIGLDVDKVETNIVIFDVSRTGKTVEAISAGLKERGVLLNGINAREMRAVTHYDVSGDDCTRAAEALEEVLAG